MLISPAFAQEVPVPQDAPATTTAETAVPGTDAAAVAPPSTQSILMQNVAMVVLLVVMFYFLLIRPQQKRFKEHKAMVDSLKVGDKVIVAGGLIGTIDRLVDDNEAIVDLGGGVKVTAMRGMLQAKIDKAVSDTTKK